MPGARDFVEEEASESGSEGTVAQEGLRAAATTDSSDSDEAPAPAASDREDPNAPGASTGHNDHRCIESDEESESDEDVSAAKTTGNMDKSGTADNSENGGGSAADHERNDAADGETGKGGADGEENAKSAGRRLKRLKRKRDESLDDEDYELIYENTGVQMGRAHETYDAQKRVRSVEGGADASKELERALFGDGDYAKAPQGGTSAGAGDGSAAIGDVTRTTGEDRIDTAGDDEGEDNLDDDDLSDADSMDDFVVDDVDDGGEGGVAQRSRPRRRVARGNRQLDYARAIFGDSFFEAYGEDEVDMGADVATRDVAEGRAEGEDGGGAGDLEGGVAAGTTTDSQVDESALATISKTIEPAIVEAEFATAEDAAVRTADIPERLSVPKRAPLSSEERRAAAEWICARLFGDKNDARAQDEGVREAVEYTLAFMHDDSLDIGFISEHRRDYVWALQRIDLWAIADLDARWLRLQRARSALEAVAPSELRAALQAAETERELGDIRAQLGAATRRARRENASDAVAGDAAGRSGELGGAGTGSSSQQRARRRAAAIVAEQFGLSASAFGENALLEAALHAPVDPAVPPLDAAAAAVVECGANSAPAVIMRRAVARYASEIATNALVRRAVRRALAPHAVVSSRPSARGAGVVDDRSHPYFPVHRLLNKPAHLFTLSSATESAEEVKRAAGQFLLLWSAEAEGLVEVEVTFPVYDASLSLGAEQKDPSMQQLEAAALSHGQSRAAREWNGLRRAAVRRAFRQQIVPLVAREVYQEKYRAAADVIVRAACDTLWFRANMKPPALPRGFNSVDDDRPNEGTRAMMRVCGALPSADGRAAVFVLLGATGELVDVFRMPLPRGRSGTERVDEAVLALRRFLVSGHVAHVAVAASGRAAVTIAELVEWGAKCGFSAAAPMREARRHWDDAEEDEAPRTVARMGRVPAPSATPELAPCGELAALEVHFVENDSARAIALSPLGARELPEHPSDVREAAWVARRLLHPLATYAAVLDSNELSSVRLTAHQERVPKALLLTELERVLCDAVPNVGVDVNHAIRSPWMAPLLRLVPGLGPRKSRELVERCRESLSGMVGAREQLLARGVVGPVVFRNCNAFLRVEGDQPLDASRISAAEGYSYAVRVACEAFGAPEDDPDRESYVIRAQESPEAVERVDIESLAAELEAAGKGRLHLTLQLICSELAYPFEDRRRPYEEMADQEVFERLLDESSYTLHPGTLVNVEVTRVIQPSCSVCGSSLLRTFATGERELYPQHDTGPDAVCACWETMVSQRGSYDLDGLSGDLREPESFWKLFRPGAVLVRLESGINARIPQRELSDQQEIAYAEDLTEFFTPGQTCFTACVTSINYEKMKVELSSRSSQLSALEGAEETLDPYLDTTELEKRKNRVKTAFLPRKVFHPFFKNLTHPQALAYLRQRAFGEFVIRPSSRSHEQLTISIKVSCPMHSDGRAAHSALEREVEDPHHVFNVDVFEKGKSSPSAIGAELRVGNETFDDIDELIARCVDPIVNNVDDLLSSEKWLCGSKEDVYTHMQREREYEPSRIFYHFAWDYDHPGRFVLYYQPGRRSCREGLKVNAEGYVFRGKQFPTVEKLIGWFKRHYKEAPPRASAVENLPPLPHDAYDQHMPLEETLQMRPPIPGFGANM